MTQKENLLIDLDTLNAFCPQQEIKINQEFIHNSSPITDEPSFFFNNSKKWVSSGASVKIETLQLLQGKWILDFQNKNKWEATLNANTLEARIGTNIYILVTKIDYEWLQKYIGILSGNQDTDWVIEPPKKEGDEYFKLRSQRENPILKKKIEMLTDLLKDSYKDQASDIPKKEQELEWSKIKNQFIKELDIDKVLLFNDTTIAITPSYYKVLNKFFKSKKTQIDIFDKSISTTMDGFKKTIVRLNKDLRKIKIAKVRKKELWYIKKG